MTDKMLIADWYDAAADYIEQNGWVQGSLYPDSNPFAPTEQIFSDIINTSPSVCMMGAGYAAQTTSQVFASMDIVADFHQSLVTELVSQPGGFVADWNDAEGRTAEEVIDLLRMTALKIRAGNIGDNPREYEFQPMPTTEPVVEPAAPQPVKEPVPA